MGEKKENNTTHTAVKISKYLCHLTIVVERILHNSFAVL